MCEQESPVKGPAEYREQVGDGLDFAASLFRHAVGIAQHDPYDGGRRIMEAAVSDITARVKGIFDAIDAGGTKVPPPPAHGPAMERLLNARAALLEAELDCRS